jgi:hypothetical protein
MSADSIQINFTFKTVNQLFYSDARLDPRNPPIPPSTSVTSTPPLANAVFYRANPNGNLVLYSMNKDQQNEGITGEVIPDIKMPAVFALQDTYLLCEYISIEENEAVALRSGMIDYRVEQHYIVAPQTTNSGQNVRVSLPFSNPVKEISWVFQRPEVANYNSWFLFTRELHSAAVQPTSWWQIPWWPDAVITTTDTALPAFRNAFSEPMQGSELTFSNIIRFSHQNSPSCFRSLLPIIHYRKAPLFNRYIYTFPFALSPGARDDKSLGSFYNPRGFSNFDKLPKKEMLFTMKSDTANSRPNLNVHAYVTTWNVFRVFGGRGVMLFAY